MMNQHIVNRLRVSGPMPTPVEASATRQALQQGLDILALEGLRAPDLKTVVWRLAQDAAETLRAMPDRERGWLASARAMWPEIARPSEDCRKIEWEVSLEQLAGVREADETPRPRYCLSDPDAVGRMLTVMAWLRFVRGKTRALIRRDQRVFIALAAGRRPIDVRYEFLPRRSSDSTLRAIKGKVLLHVTLGLRPYTKQLTFNGRSRNLR